jgi:hypothetical protein
LTSSETRESADASMERRWMYYYALGEAMRIVYKTSSRDLNQALGFLANPSWISKSNDDPIKKTIARFSKIAFRSLSESYEMAASKEGFRHRNWYRSESTLSSINEHITSIWELLSEYADDHVLPKL